MRIYQLPQELSNQIAAGEVIERPASVVKELLENALDAAATAIQVDIELGGLACIRVLDNGAGIMEEDLPLAIAAHATSKIKTLNDLYNLYTLGFRGEALASIASVSRMTICSKPASQAEAVSLTVESGKLRLSPAARNQGTTIEVRDLFYNAPVRKKFLKSERSEYLVIENLLKRAAMCKPEVAFNLSHNGKVTLKLPAAETEQNQQLRIKKLLGKEFFEQAIFLNAELGELKLQGWISKLSFDRSQNDKIWIYVNQRMVKDKLMQHAIKQAYENKLPPGRFPACLLYLTLPPGELDVNVHPTKHEVRFQEPRLVHDFISSTLQQALQEKQELQSLDYTESLQPLGDNEIPERGLSSSYLPSMTEETNQNWSFLNEQFAILRLNRQSFLVDVSFIQQQQLAESLSHERYPLPSRPLLVPVRAEIESQARSFFEACQPILADFAIQFDFIGENQLLFRSIPQHMPQLDIQQLMEVLQNRARAQKIPPAHSQMLDLLLQSLHCDIRQLDKEEQRQIADYLQALLQKNTESTGFMILDASRCEALLYG